MKLILSGALLVVMGCSGCETTSTSSSLKTGTPTLCGESVTLEIARSSEEKSKGLMNRAGLLHNSGMIFVYTTEEKLTFWMKDVSFPISIGFFDSLGRLRESAEMTPESPSTPDHLLKRYSSSVNVQYAVEMSQNWFQNRTNCMLDLSFLNP